jgi:hypothetical protein
MPPPRVVCCALNAICCRAPYQLLVCCALYSSFLYFGFSSALPFTLVVRVRFVARAAFSPPAALHTTPRFTLIGRDWFPAFSGSPRRTGYAPHARSDACRAVCSCWLWLTGCRAFVVLLPFWFWRGLYWF